MDLQVESIKFEYTDLTEGSRGEQAYMNIIFDCDNTFGVKGCDVDDGLALLYLLGSDKANLLGITNTYGNSDIETVYTATHKMLEDIGRTDIPHYKGCPRPGEKQSEAVDFLVDMVNQYAENVSIIATGSLTNLYGACQKDEDFLNKINSISLMGGLTDHLYINDTILDELNFSCDPAAAFQVLTKSRKVGIATGNNCLGAFFSYKDHVNRFQVSPEPIARYLYEKTAYWYEHNMTSYGLDGFYNWDVTAAAYLLDPELFESNKMAITPDLESLKSGFLNGRGKEILIDLPNIRDQKQFQEKVYSNYMKVKIKV
ncbi:nucleoside hydrolase [Aminipila terrae]|nr:nucleoside hydrolase [Aminipila terrae]